MRPRSGLLGRLVPAVGIVALVGVASGLTDLPFGCGSTALCAAVPRFGVNGKQYVSVMAGNEVLTFGLP